VGAFFVAEPYVDTDALFLIAMSNGKMIRSV